MLFHTASPVPMLEICLMNALDFYNSAVIQGSRVRKAPYSGGFGVSHPAANPYARVLPGGSHRRKI